MSSERFFVFCEPCGFKQVVEDSSKVQLVEIPTTPIPRGAPVLDTVTGKMKTAKPIPQKRKFKCPKCGRGVAAKGVPEPYSKIIQQREDKEADERRRQELEKEGFTTVAIKSTKI